MSNQEPSAAPFRGQIVYKVRASWSHKEGPQLFEIKVISVTPKTVKVDGCRGSEFKSLYMPATFFDYYSRTAAEAIDRYIGDAESALAEAQAKLDAARKLKG